jgi:hypothetical protein
MILWILFSTKLIYTAFRISLWFSKYFLVRVSRRGAARAWRHRAVEMFEMANVRVPRLLWRGTTSNRHSFSFYQ